ncbi:MAG: DUF29 domain-containing protein, partial [Waterburya sp.]
EQSQFLREKKFELLDIANLAEEIESLGKSDKRKLESLLLRLFEHLLKRKYTGMQECYRGWDVEIRNFSRQIKKLLQDSPSLKNYLQEIALNCYQEAIETVEQDYEIYNFSAGLDVEEIITSLKK